MKMNLLPAFLFLVIFAACTSTETTQKSDTTPQQPNIVLVITDDQGYGDVAAHGNPVIQTPALDKLHSESIRLTDFHVNPTCAPTRAALMTGRNKNRVGVWHTIVGRSFLREGETTMAEVLQQNGYTTGLFGKWHLGDHYPYLPQDRGFEEVVMHGGGGVTQTPDYWNNDYFDDTYWHNGVPKKFEGYCTDVWFQEAMRFMEQSAQSEQPFFCYIATNAPHNPFNVSDEYYSKYVGANGTPKEGVPNPNFYGMITNIDDNMARLDAFLREKGLFENTLFIFMTDNGTSAGVKMGEDQFPEQPGFNAGMRGKKGSPYEGGHRVPCFLRWPSGNLSGGKDLDVLTTCMDILPTFTELLALDFEPQQPLDGQSLASLLRGEATPEWASTRTIITDTQRKQYLEKWRNACVMQGKWRLMFGESLYNLAQDPGQHTDVAADHPEKVAELRQAYEHFWTEIEPNQAYERLLVGHPEHNPVELTVHDARVPEGQFLAWNQYAVRNARSGTGSWALKVHEAGNYRFTINRWPASTGLGINEEVPAGDPIPHGDAYQASDTPPIGKVTWQLGEASGTIAIDEANPQAVFERELAAGETSLSTCFFTATGDSLGAFYVMVEKM